MSLLWRVIAVLFVAAFGLQPAVAAKKGASPGGHLKVTEVFLVEGNPDTLMIAGEDFDFGDGALMVTLGELGEVAVISSDATTIEVEIPDLSPGDYLVSVFREGGQSQGDEYDLTIGAVGPQGPPGPPGPRGPRGVDASIPDSPCFDNTNRYVDCGNGTVTDTVTGLIWLKNANCLELQNLYPGYALGQYAAANEAASLLQDGDCDLTDNSAPGDWRLATKHEWENTIAQALVLGCSSPTLTDVSGTTCFANDPPFIDVQPYQHWTSRAYAPDPSQAWNASIGIGTVGHYAKSGYMYVWPVRGSLE